MVEKPTAEEFRSEFPEFIDTDTPAIERAIDAAYVIYKNEMTGLLYLSAHFAVVLGSSGSGVTASSNTGEVISKRVGPISYTFKPISQSSDQSFYASTKYGQSYLAIRAATTAFSMRVH